MQSLLRILPPLALASLCTAQDGEQFLVGLDTAAGDDFGEALAIEGDTLLIGASDHASAGFSAGAAYVFTRTGGVWSEAQKLSPPEVEIQDRFGIAVTLDGDRLAVGASLDEDGDGDLTGAVYVFERSGSTWVQTARLTDDALSGTTEFGFSLDLEGDRLAVGAHEASGGGQVTVFELDQGLWTQLFTVQSPDAGATDDFGYSVALDAGYLLVGAPFHDGLDGNAGATYLYDDQGDFLEKQEASGASLSGAEFGYAIAMEDGVAVVGAGSENTDGGSDAGAAYVFRRVGDTLVEEARLVAPDVLPSATSDLFGRAVDVSSGRVAVGAERALSDEGRAYLFAQDGSGWGLASVFTAGDVNSSDRFGGAVALDAETVAVGIFNADDAGSNSGRVSAFDLTAGLLGGIVPLDLSDGGTQFLAVEGGAAQAGQLFAIVGSLSGTVPGFTIQGQLIPLNPDSYFLSTVSAPNAPPLTNSFGVLDANGIAFARIDVPAGTDPSLAGLTVHHVAVVISPATLQIQSVSRPLPTLFEQ